MPSPHAKNILGGDLELERIISFLEKTTSFHRAYPENKFSDPQLYGTTYKGKIYIQIDNVDYNSEISSVDKNKKGIVYINGNKYSFVYPGDREEVVLTRVF
jgi:hypothetical protein